MLSPGEFTVGNVGDAEPLSLILPIDEYDVTMLVGQINGVAVAVFLSGQHKSSFFESDGNENWSGLIIKDVRIEVDETSVLDARASDLLSVIRIDTRLVMAARRERTLGRPTMITLHDNLNSAGDRQAAFAKWQVVLGDGERKRILWTSAMSA